MYYVYILFSCSLEKFYVGSTNDLLKRINRHHSGGSPFTIQGKPWILIFSIECTSRLEAVVLEMKSKKEE